jgi:predicted alpha/beta hydrolase family esterase
MSVDTEVLTWKETKNGITIDCSLRLALHPEESGQILLTVPGVDGSLDGYEDKYLKIAEAVQSRHGAAVVRMENPFITSFHWESNLRQALGFIENNLNSLTFHSDPIVYIMAHSAGASVAAHISHEYPRIKRLLLINPATKLDMHRIESGLSKFNGETPTILIGSQDPSFADVGSLNNVNIVVEQGADHHFSGKSFKTFQDSPHNYLFFD